MRVDLHIHSTASDGRWRPEQLVKQVRQAGIDLFAVADHDTIANVRPVEDAVRGNGLGFIRAVEISTTFQGQLFHIVAYGINLEHPGLLRTLNENQDKMEGVDLQSIEKLIQAGYDISYKEYETYENDVSRGGWKALNLFIDRGICSDVRDFFGRLFVGDMSLVMPDFATPDQVVHVAHEAGGKAICAHPGNNIGPDNTPLLDRLVDRGIDGIECYSPYHDKATTQRFIDYCQRRDLLITAGSDCHGGSVGRALGRPGAYVDDLNLGPLLDYVIR